MALVGPKGLRVPPWHLTAAAATRGRHCPGRSHHHGGHPSLPRPQPTAGPTAWGTHCCAGTQASPS